MGLGAVARAAVIAVVPLLLRAGVPKVAVAVAAAG